MTDLSKERERAAVGLIAGELARVRRELGARLIEYDTLTRLMKMLPPDEPDAAAIRGQGQMHED